MVLFLKLAQAGFLAYAGNERKEPLLIQNNSALNLLPRIGITLTIGTMQLIQLPFKIQFQGMLLDALN
jgi:hypothetical protein